MFLLILGIEVLMLLSFAYFVIVSIKYFRQDVPNTDISKSGNQEEHKMMQVRLRGGEQHHVVTYKFVFLNKVDISIKLIPL